MIWNTLRDIVGGTSDYVVTRASAWWVGRGQGAGERSTPRFSGKIRGHVDIVSHQAIAGWLSIDLGPESPIRYAQIFLDGVEVGTARADLFRADLKDHGISNGYAGFRFVFAVPPNPFANHILEVRDRDTGVVVAPGPIRLRSVFGRRSSSYLRIDPRLVTTNVRTVHYDNGVWQLEAELFGPKRLSLAPSVEGGAIEVFHQRVDADRFLKGLEHKVAALRIRPDPQAEVIRLELERDGAKSLRCEPVCHIVLPKQIPDYVNKIGVENMVRVSGGGVTPSLFAASGVTTAFRVDSLIRRHFGRGLHEFGRILDWGVGAGRVALPVKKFIAPNSKVVGIDVDSFNIELGKASFEDVEFVQSALYPPSPFAANSFDAAYGISVLTHLTQSAQFAWLEELRRVVKPGAPVILTVHGEYGIVNAATQDPDILGTTLRYGFSDHTMDMNLGPKLKDKSYYRATFHARQYIAERWAEHFDVVAQYSCANVIIQDFVVLRAK